MFVSYLFYTLLLLKIEMGVNGEDNYVLSTIYHVCGEVLLLISFFSIGHSLKVFSGAICSSFTESLFMLLLCVP